MKIVCDDKIPFIREALLALASEVVFKPGREITADDVRDADILIVRTRTRCDSNLLSSSKVKLIVTATIGFDHIDTEFLEKAGIEWKNCPGCNANSVAQYIRNTLFLLERERGVKLSKSTVGIIGVGHVGTAVWQALNDLPTNLHPTRILFNDPPREEQGLPTPDGSRWSSIDEIAHFCDIITLHTPLIHNGKHPTFHLIGKGFINKLGRHPVLINAGRGGVADEVAVEQALDDGHLQEAVIDTWEGEPSIKLSLLNKV